MEIKDEVYHKQCFSCKRCGRSMDSLAVAVGPDQDIYCNVCLKIVSAPERPQVITDTTIIMGSGDPENKDSCPRCGGKVFEAEKMTGKYGAYHRQCFKCMKCKRPLDYQTLAEGPDNDIYCNHCYELIHGKKAKTKSMPLDTTSIMGEAELGTCPRCSGKVFSAEKMVAASGHYHRHCFRCFTCNQPLDSTSVCDGPDNKIFCRVCYKRQRGSSKPRFFDEANVTTHLIQGKEGEKCCPRCNGMVFPAEKMVSINNWYHKRCFSCRDCQRPLDPFLCCDTPDMEIVCKGCYAKSYSVTSEWCTMSGGDALKLLSTTTIMPGEGDSGENCPRCNGKVFHNERVPTKGKAYHKRCATCKNCEKNIGTKDILNGEDNNIYCKFCYHRNFAPVGYRD